MEINNYSKMKFAKRGFLSAFFCFSTFSVVTMGNPKPAHAWFEICNQSTQTVTAAFAYEDVTGRDRDIFGNAPPQLSKGWTSEGWWTLKSGQCAQVYPHDLRDRSSYYYVYAKGDSGGVWEGKNPFCVTNSGFTLGFANRNCGGRGRFENFKEVNTGNSRNFTYRFTESAPQPFDYEERTRQLYRQVLGREADTSGFRDNVNAMRQNSFELVRARMAGSQESRNNINNMYRQYLCRNADPVGMDHWINLLASGQMVLDQVRNGIANSTEAQQHKNGCR